MADLDDVTRDLVRDGAATSARYLAPLMVASWGRGKCPGRVCDVGAGEGWFTREIQITCPLSDTMAIDLAGTGGPNEHSGIRIEHWDAEARDVIPPCDMAICLEMAEHVDADTGAWLVGALTSAASWGVWWSAAIPGQGGDGHVNEQWPGYWNEAFRKHGWILTDPVRDLIWDHPQIEPWYKQNLLLARPQTAGVSLSPIRALIHPVTYAYHRGVVYP